MAESTSSERTALEVEDVSKTFGPTRALAGVSLSVKAGEVHAVVGQNGSGKSTLVKILSGFQAPDPSSGSIKVDGTEVNKHGPAESARLGLRFVHQDLGLVHDLNAVENLGLGVGFDSGRLGRIRWSAARADAERRVRELGYGFDVTVPVGELKPAERTGIAVARALRDADDIKVLVIDEPTATLPPAEVELLFDAVEHVRSRGVAVLYISHRLDEVFRIADRVTVMRDGRRVATQDVRDLDQPDLVELMVGDIELTTRREYRPRTTDDVVLSATGLRGETLDGVDLTVHRGEIVGVAGLTGSGREELLPVLFGSRPSTGDVNIEGTNLPRESVGASIKNGVALVPADRATDGAILTMSVRDNCTLTDLRRHSNRWGAIRRRVEAREVDGWIRSLSIRTAGQDVPMKSLSGGNQQKIVISKWLRTKPQVLLLDEPTQGVDIGAKASIHRLAREAADQGTAVVIASSDELELCDTCDRVVVFADGQVVGELIGEHITPRAIANLQH